MVSRFVRKVRTASGAVAVQDLSSPFGLTVDQIISDGGIVLGDTPGIGISVDEVAIGAAKAISGWSTPTGPHVRPDRAGLRLIPEQ